MEPSTSFGPGGTTQRDAAQTLCPICNQEMTPHVLYRIDRYTIGECPGCKIVYLLDPPSRQQLEELYSIGYFEGDLARRGYQSYSEDRRILEVNFAATLREVLAALSVKDKRPGGLLEIGCAYGYFLNLARPHFESVQGIEFSADAGHYAQRELGLNVAIGDLQEVALPDQAFDVVALWDVIEHLSDPKSVVKKISRLLKDGGDVFLTTGDVRSLYSRMAGKRWRLINPPQHLFYFSEPTLRKLFEDEGFEVIASHHAGKHVSVGFIAFILSYLMGSRWVDRIKSTPMGRKLFQKSIRINLFDVLFFHARKKNQ